ncbi:phage protein, QlrG family [[Clostridium] bifermentans ATCC 638]|uniref:Phage protein, QlrG family n=1 Tax=Paraclostridium bifermentans ATCC 638 = DSM 14991 TaxID=1233171 RepID=T4VP58_PARBF|nr:head-tail connector protein [Paraclostridium bifermentans]EQK42915.1 phage protein, QlrG family [[Clostridium] bifermentans ATCC 638] [Paraclostridium bifermentans ATCC 638 = DSM 14991]RIZ58044.1 phage gp6-like head-tail connector protein [Paraclostridium bifermentans]UAG16799.1 head-tail connector protein [Paraclostridium bifermentans]
MKNVGLLELGKLHKEYADMVFDEIRVFVRVDVDDTELIDELWSLILSAEIYLKNAGCYFNYYNELFVLAMKLVVSFYNENGKSEDFGYSLRTIITQLKYCYGDENE